MDKDKNKKDEDLVDEKIEQGKETESAEEVEEGRVPDTWDDTSRFKMEGEKDEGPGEIELPEDVDDIEENLFPSAD